MKNGVGAVFKPFMQLAALVVVLSLSGCASVGVIPLSSNMARVSRWKCPDRSVPTLSWQAQDLALHHASISHDQLWGSTEIHNPIGRCWKSDPREAAYGGIAARYSYHPHVPRRRRWGR